MRQIEIKNGRIIIPSELVLARRFKRPFKEILPGVIWMKGNQKLWMIHATDEDIERVNALFRLKKPLKPVDEHLQSAVTDFINNPNVRFKTDPYRHQVEALAKGYKREAFGYLMDPGLGKTKVLIDDAAILHRECGLQAVLGLCPKSILHVWVNEIKQHSSVPYKITVWPKVPDRNDKFEGVHWFLMNYDALTLGRSVQQLRRSLACKAAKEGKAEKAKELFEASRTKYDKDGLTAAKTFLQDYYPAMLCADESTEIKNHDAGRTKAAFELKTKAKFRRILTGTPLANTIIDAWAQLYFLGNEAVDYLSLPNFTNEFCIMGGWHDKQILGYRNKAKFNRMLATAGIRIRADEALDLPEATYQVRQIQLNPKTKKVYEALATELLAELEDGKEVKAVNILGQLIKLYRITGGTVKTTDGTITQVGNEKLLELHRVVDEAGSGVLVWCQFRAEIDLIVKHFKQHNYRVAELHGGTSKEDRAKVNADFERGKYDILVLQNRAGSMGVTLNYARVSVFYSNHLQPMIREQSEKRNHRIGQDKNVLYVDLICPGYIDEHIYRLLMRKTALNQELVNGVSKEVVKNIIRPKEETSDKRYDGRPSA